MAKKQKLLVPTLMTLLGIAVLSGLGYWQLERLEWKTRLLAALDAEYTLDATQTLLEPPQTDDEYLFRRGTLRGTFDFSKQVLIEPRVYDNLPGKHVVTPLRFEDGSWILVNRGWAPQSWKETDENRSQISGRTTVTGLLRKPDENPFRPPNEPDRNKWYSINIADMAAAKNLQGLHAYVLYEEKTSESTEYPLAAATRPEMHNDHLQYAVFWFTMAGILGIIYILRFLRKQK